VGFFISAWTRKSATATGAAILTWLALAFFGDLAVVGATLALRPTPAHLMGMLVINPLQTFKLGAIYSLNSTLDVLGAVGQYAFYRFGNELPALLAGLLFAWILLAFSLAYFVFSRGGYE
jgi:ABC-type transport system involved in multi-copper enzyme maturation permease subunit